MIRPILKKTPYELLRGRKPNIAHLRCFGSKCFVHNNGKTNLSKFDPRSDEAVFVGYSNHSKAYKVFNKRTLCIEESVHVVFDEDNMFEKAEQNEEEDLDDPDFCLSRDDVPEDVEEVIEGINDELEKSANDLEKRTETNVNDTNVSSPIKNGKSKVIASDATTLNPDQEDVTEVATTSGTTPESNSGEPILIPNH